MPRADKTAVFEFYVRQLLDQRNFPVTAGLAQVVKYLTGLPYDDNDLAWVRESGQFDAGFIDSLHDSRFTGDMDAVTGGTVVYANEPLLRITAPLRKAQSIESFLINLLHYQTILASKAARCVIAAQGGRLGDFGLRRAHGGEASLLSARASYIAVFDDTATTLAAPCWDPNVGHDGAFLRARARPRKRCVLDIRACRVGKCNAADRHLRHQSRGATGGAGSTMAVGGRGYSGKGGLDRQRLPGCGGGPGALITQRRSMSGYWRLC